MVRVFIGMLICTLSAHALEVLPEKAPVPKDNKMSAAKIELGKQLYFDTRLSKTERVSCNSCHNVMAGGTDEKRVSEGIDGLKGGRNAPTVWNSAFMSVQFWDGRAATLEDQAKGPVLNPIEMGMPDEKLVIERLSKVKAYREQFKKVFGSEDVTLNRFAQAVAAYERTLITPNSPYDRYVKGEKKAMTAAAVRGLKKVQEVGCTSCHSGPMFAGPSFPVGTGFYQKFPMIPGSEYEGKYELTKDLGRYEATKNDSDKNMWRVPTWRNIAMTAPYFHNGSVDSLDEAVRVMAKTQLGKTLAENEVKDIVEFLKSLTGKFPKQTAPKVPN